MNDKLIHKNIYYEGVSEQGGAFIYRGQVQKYSDLPTINNQVGDVYNIVEKDTVHKINAGENVAWNGSSWDDLGGTTDISMKADKTYVDNNFVLKSVYEAKIAELLAQIDELRDIIEKHHSVIDDRNGQLTMDTEVVGEPIVNEQELTTPNLEVISDDEGNIILK